MTCEYFLNGLKIGTLQDLYNYLENKKLYNDALDVIFSGEEINRQQAQCNNLENIKEIANDNFIVGGTDEDGGFRGKNGEFSVGEFLDNSGEAIIDGRRVYTPLDRDAFKNHKIQIYTRQEGKSPEEAKLLVERELNSWSYIQQISRDLHRIGISKFIGGSKESELERKQNFISFAKGITSFFSDEMLGKLFDELNSFYVINKGFLDGSKCFRGINLKSKLANSDTSLFSHIDYAIVDDRGNLHIFNFKVSSQFFGNWSEEKKEKYELEQAFTKQMLSDNGVDIKGITIHNVPIKLTFNSSFTSIDDVNIPVKEGIKYNNTKDNVAKYFIKNKRTVIKDPSMQDMDNTKELYQAIFPSLQVGNEGIMQNVYDWIKRAPAFGSEQPITIREINDGEHRYVVTIDGKPHLISDFSEKENNKEIYNLIKEHISRLNEDYSNRTEDIVNAIKHSFNRKLKGFDFSRLKDGQNYLDVLLKQYISYDIIDAKDGNESIRYKWEFIDTLADCGILMFRNVDTQQLDTVVLSSKNLNQIPKYNYGNNILGGYLTNRDFQWRGTYGNVETVRGIILLNTILPQLEDIRLGNIKVISSQGMSYRYNLEHVIKDYMKDIFKIVKRKNPELSFQNNYVKAKYIDLFNNLIEEYDNIIQLPSSTSRILKEIVDNKFELKKEELQMEDEGKRAVLLSIMESFEEQFPNITSNPLLALETTDLNQRRLAKFYIQLSQAYLYYSHENLEYNEQLSTIDKNMYTSPTIPNSNINIIVTNLQKTVDSISEECDQEYSKNIRSFIMDFYKAAGYTSTENFTLGTQNRLFNNLYQTDSKGKRILVFKNPYDDPTLKDYERTFLKKALFYFNKYRFRDNDNKKFTSWNDPEIPEYIKTHGEYLNVPLKRASNATHRQRFSIQDKVDNMTRVMKVVLKTKGKSLYDEFVNGMTEDEAEYFRQGMDSMRFHDPFQRSEKDRIEYIEKNGVNYFETNVEDLLAERLFNSIYTEKINRMLLGTKALLLQMSILGENSGTEKTFKDEQEFIQKYIGLHIFKQPITDKGLAQGIMATGQGLRRNVTFLNIAGNVIAAARDVENGFMENYIRTASKYMTNISSKNLSKAYAYVVKNGTMDAMKMTLLSKLCVKYRLSNTDTARIVERLKTGRQGLTNWDNMMYSTLRAPDFLNRMTLFIARAMEDGVLDAWEVKDGELIYNWRKDKRFNLLTSEANKDNPEYKKQKALYMMYIKEWNQDHPDPTKQLKYTDDLPTPYSNQEILSIKEVSDNIYGSYDKSKRQMGDFTAIGTFFGMYTTWMNGIWNNWMMKPGKYNVSKMTTEQDTDLEGNLLFQDENGNYYTEKTLENGEKQYINEDSGETKDISELNPVLKHVPVPVQGVIYTLQGAAQVLKNDGLDAAIKYITDDPNTWNSIKQLLITALLAAFFGMLFKFVLDPAYQETKKSYKDMDGINILLTEMAYRPLKPATDSLYGIYNVIEYLGENTDPPIYNVPTKFVADAWKTAFGNKTAGQFISGNFAFARIFKQLANAKA